MAQIFIIEDERAIAMVLKIVLGDLGHDVVSFQNGLEGYTYMECHQPELVIMDLNLPGMDGRTIAEKMHLNHNLKNIPVIIMSGSIPSDANLPSKDTYKAFIEKPFDLVEVEDVVQNLLAVYIAPEAFNLAIS